jgi:hypothetical protein
MEHQWKKEEKTFYLPGPQPALIDIPAFSFFTISGKGNPNEPFFAEYVGVLYALAYAVKMSPTAGLAPTGYEPYSVYPLEGVWDISEEAKSKPIAVFDKSQLVFTLMIRQPDFVTTQYAMETIERTMSKKHLPLLEQVRFETLTEGKCVQMLHVGDFDSEPESFKKMDTFIKNSNLRRADQTHREIYLSDARKTPSEKLRTVLRVKVK